MIFDVLRVDGRDVIDLPWRERRTVLERLALRGPSWQTPPIVEADADAALTAAAQLGLEGIVAKRIDSPYRPGKRTTAWQKTKLTNRQELVVGRMAARRRAAHRDARLVAGRVLRARAASDRSSTPGASGPASTTRRARRWRRSWSCARRARSSAHRSSPARSGSSPTRSPRSSSASGRTTACCASPSSAAPRRQGPRRRRPRTLTEPRMRPSTPYFR